MSVIQVVTLLLIGISAGVLSGTFGVGGGIIIVPALVFFLGLTQREAQGTSLLILLLPVGIFAVMNYYKQGYMKVSYALIIIVAFVVGAYLGSLIAVNLPDKTLKKIFAVFMVVVAIKMLLE